MFHCKFRVRCAAFLAAVVVSVLLIHTTQTAWADTTTCVQDEYNMTLSTGCYTAAQQKHTLAVLRAFSDAIPGFQRYWVGDDFCAWSHHIFCYPEAVQIYVHNEDEVSLVGSLPEIPPTVDSNECVFNGVTLVPPEPTLTGTLPESWNRLTKLNYIKLRSSEITGTLPEWPALTQLEFIELDNTSITGTLPAAWSQKKQLAILAVSASHVSGTLPESWGSFPLLRHMILYDNELSGPLPSSWGALTSLFVASLEGNNFCGCLPASWLTSDSPLAQSNAVDAKNTVAGGCATTNVCPAVIPTTTTTTTTETPTTSTTTTEAPSTSPTTSTTEAPTTSTTTTSTSTAAPCSVAHCVKCVGGSSDECQACEFGYVLTTTYGCVQSGNNAAAGMPSLATGAAVVASALLLLSF